MKDKKYFDSLDKLKSGCATSQLFRSCERNGIWSFSPLPHLEGHVMRWTLMYGLIDGDACRAEFVSRPAGGNPVWGESPRRSLLLCHDFSLYYLPRLHPFLFAHFVVYFF